MLKLILTVPFIVGSLFAATSELQPCVKKAEKAFRNRQFDKTLTILSGCMEDSATNCMKGLSYYGLYNPDSVVEYLGRAARSSSATDTVLICLAESRLWKKEFDEAHRLLARTDDKTLPGYKRVAALYLEMTGELAGAAALYDSLILVEKQPWNSLMRKAQVLSWMKRFDESIVIFSRVALSDSAPLPVRLSAVIRRAEVKAWQHQFPSAFHELDSLIHLLARVKDPVSRDRIVEALQLKGQVLEWDGRFQEAKETYKDILLKDPGNKRAKLILEKLLWVK